MLQINRQCFDPISKSCLATYSQWDADLDNVSLNLTDFCRLSVLTQKQEYLRACYRMKGSLVIDSSSPHCFPHVVITPCDNSDDDCTAWDNYTEPQNCDYLSVPESSTSSTPLYPSSHVETHDAAVPISQPPKKVFSRSRFTAMVRFCDNALFIAHLSVMFGRSIVLSLTASKCFTS